MSDYIPADLLAKVLLRLPLESLLRSRCVSKSWRALIDSPHFIKLHFNKRYSLNPNSDNDDDDDIMIFALTSDKFYSLQFNNLIDSSIATAKQLNFPLKHPKSEIRLVGSCNGLVCLSSSHSDIVLWNPLAQKYWELPSPQVQDSVSRQAFFRLGFGYDQDTDDYKVVNLVTFYDILEGSLSSSLDEVYVYSLKQNSWKRLTGDFPLKFPAQFRPDIGGALANGSLHWTVNANEWDDMKSILAFDLRIEKFSLMPCPIYPNDAFDHNLRILNGSLCFLPYYFASGQYLVDLWVMEEYGPRNESWEMLFSIEVPNVAWSLRYITPVKYLKSRRKVVLQIESEKLVIYDLFTRSMEDVITKSGAVATSNNACLVFGSLVQPYFAGGSETA